MVYSGHIMIHVEGDWQTIKKAVDLVRDTVGITKIGTRFIEDQDIFHIRFLFSDPFCLSNFITKLWSNVWQNGPWLHAIETRAGEEFADWPIPLEKSVAVPESVS